MKNKILGLFLTMAMVLLPMNVSAADSFSGSVFGSEDSNMTKTTLNSASITCPKVGNTATCYIGIKVTSGTAKAFNVEATLTNMTYDSYEMMGGWTMKSPTQSGSKINFEFTNKTGTTAGNTVLVAKITYKVADVTENCSVKITSTNVPEGKKTCEVEDGKYYCLDGNVCQKEQYDKECTPENPQTGSFLPYAVVVAGLGIAGALYFVTRKKAKIYHV